MSLYTLPNQTTPDGILLGISEQVPAFPIMSLILVWFIIFIGGSKRQSDKTGMSDMPQWGLLASVTVLVLGLLMTITAGIISLQTLIIIVAINILTATWYFLSRGRFD